MPAINLILITCVLAVGAVVINQIIPGGISNFMPAIQGHYG